MQLVLHLIINYQAGSGNGKKVAKDVLATLKEKKITHTISETKYQGHAIERTLDLLETTLIPWQENKLPDLFLLLVVVGGDGTLHEVLNALRENFEIPIGYIPAGSGNDFSRGIALSRNHLVALDHLLQLESPREITVGFYHEKKQNQRGYFANNLGIGIDAAIVTQANKSKTKQNLNKFKLGSMTYIAAIIGVIFQQEGFPISVKTEHENREFNNAFLCTTTNHPYFGGGVAIAPTADPFSPEMELIVIERINMFKIFYLISLILRKKHLQSKHVYHFKSEAIRISSTTKQPVQADGETFIADSFDFEFGHRKRLFWL